METTAAAVTGKVALVCPALTFTLGGTVTLVLLLSSVTVTAFVAGALKVTVQLVVPGASMVRLLQFKLLRVAVDGEDDGDDDSEDDREMEPGLPIEGMEMPAAVDATTFVSWMGIVLLEGFDAIWKVAMATGPSAMAVVLNPTMRQLFPEQERILPALVVDDAAATVTLVTSGE